MTQSLAVVGLSLRYPGFCGPHAFFNSCRDPRSRLQKAALSTVRPYQQNHPRGLNHPYRINNDLYGSIRDMSWIDARRFRVPPSDIEGDPSPFLCLQVASEALLDHQAGRPDSYIPRHRTGVVIGRGDHPHRGVWSGLQGGTGLEVIRELLLEHPDFFSVQQVDAFVEVLLQRLEPFPNPSIAASLVSNVISGLVANRLDLQGPNSLVDAACTSAIVAIQQAARSLAEGETDLMLVGASQATMAVPIIQMFSMLGAISKTDIQPFNSLIDGTLLSEGVGFVALKRLEDARQDSDRIYAIIRGFGLASDGNDSSILAPSSRGQIQAMRNTYAQLEDIKPDDIGFLEAHATGINLGDLTELNSVQEVFRPQERRRPLAMGALKSLIGHSIPASGMAAMIRAIYAVAYGIYPGSRCDQPIEQLRSIPGGLFLPMASSPWYERPSVPRRAAVNCFGFGGINGHLVIEQHMLPTDQKLLSASGLLASTTCGTTTATLRPSNQAQSRSLVSTSCPVNLICLSFADEDELRTIASLALASLEKLEEKNESCLRFGVDKRKESIYRIGLVDRSRLRLKATLQGLIDHPETHHSLSRSLPKIEPDLAVMLPGEALIPFGHLSELARFIPSVKALLEFVESASTDDSLLVDSLHPAWGSLLSENEIATLQSAANHHDNATKCLFVVAVAYFGLLRSLGIKPSALVGHSTGEINALMLAGGLNCNEISDVQSVLRSFDNLYADSSYLDEVVEGTAVLVSGLSDEQLDECLLQVDDLYLVSDNSPSHRLIFSQKKGFDQLSALFSEFGGFVFPTPLDRGYHTPLFSNGAEMMQSFYSQLPLSHLRCRVYSCCSAEQYPNAPVDQVKLLAKQWKEPVRFRQVLLNMYRDGQRLFLELNASRTLLGFAESTFHGFEDVSLLSTGSSKQNESIDAFAQSIMSLWLSGMEVDWDKWDGLFSFPESLSLPEISRPPNAISISHELYQYSNDDRRDAWSAALSADSSSDRSFSEQDGEAKSTVHHPVGSNHPLTVAGQHQQAMRRVLDSLDQNTLMLLKRLKKDSTG
ncbi:MAG: beta-ketoacyl synthase N-terminal-like domain-containing protein [Planctomycetota bacterium]|nr:beta-ketoacyl synthase N-terminal-like domain-containing protein [Planctomycetota bacterium]